MGMTLVRGDLNDRVVDDRGRIYVGNLGYDFFGDENKALADLIVVEPDGAPRIAVGECDFPNGTVIKYADRTLVVAETWSCRLTAFDRADDGNLSGQHIYADLGARMPDGICIDGEGGIWVSSFNSGEFVRVHEGGEATDRVLCEGKRAVACQLGGRDGRTLFCCTDGGTVEEIHTRACRGHRDRAGRRFRSHGHVKSRKTIKQGKRQCNAM